MLLVIIFFTLLTPSWEPRYLAGRLAATGSCCSFRMTLPSLSRGSHAEPTVGEGQVQPYVCEVVVILGWLQHEHEDHNFKYLHPPHNAYHTV